MLDCEYDFFIFCVKKGLNLVLVFDDISENIYEKYFLSFVYIWLYCDEVYLRKGVDFMCFFMVFQKDFIYLDWYLFVYDCFIDLVNVILKLGEFDVVVELKVGCGKVLLYVIFKLFQNYQVNICLGLFNVEVVLFYFSKKRGLVFLLFVDVRNFDLNVMVEGLGEDNSYFKYIMEWLFFCWVMILIILGILFYVIFCVRCCQNIVLLVFEKWDMMFVFVEMFGMIYLLCNNVYGMFQVMKKNFYFIVNCFFYVDFFFELKWEVELQCLCMKFGYDEVLFDEIICGLEVLKVEQVFVNNCMLGELYIKIC